VDPAVRGCLLVHGCGCVAVDGVLVTRCEKHLRPAKPTALELQLAQEREIRERRLEADGDRHHYGGDDEE
jgi:hypothetical protein